MSEPAKPYTHQEIEEIRLSVEHRVGSPEKEHWGSDSRWLATVDDQVTEAVKVIEYWERQVADLKGEVSRLRPLQKALELMVKQRDEFLAERDALRETLLRVRNKLLTAGLKGRDVVELAESVERRISEFFQQNMVKMGVMLPPLESCAECKAGKCREWDHHPCGCMCSCHYLRKKEVVANKDVI